MRIKIIKEQLSVCKVTDYATVRLDAGLCFTGHTDEENSLVCETSRVPADTVERDDGWRAFRIVGELDFSLIGILSRIAGLLAENQIGIFAISTYNTDYVLTKAENFEKAVRVLGESGYEVEY